jgi:2-desacetyl-2-hydroxyethyl bacteriochlorophyllide A dehydrogenase
MKSVYINAPGQVEIRETPMPVRKKGEALLKLLYGGICGSDLGSYRGTFAYFSYPRIPGHEFSAQIVDIDENEYGLEKGMIVTCNPYFNCGSCYSCRRGLVNACMDNQTMGCQRDGAFSEYITMPLARIYDGKGLDPRTLAAIEPFCISYHGVQRANIQKGDKVLVIGAGTIGVLAACAAKALGGEIYLCDVAPDKLRYAMDTFGFAGTILNVHPQALQKAVEEITGATTIGGSTAGLGFDVCIEAVGLPETFQNCIDAAAFGGRVVLIGIGKRNLDFNFSLIQKKELNVYGSRNALKKDFTELIDLVNSGEVDLGKIITHIYPLDQIGQALADFDQNSGQMLKVMIDFTSR